MNRRNLIKTLLFGITAFFSFKPEAKAYPILTKRSYSFKSQLTRDVVIPMPDGTLELNCYNEYCAFMGDAVTSEHPWKRYRFLSNVFLLDDLDKDKWNKFITECKSYVEKDNFENAIDVTNVLSLCKKITIQL